MKKVKAYWLRLWHSWWYTIKELPIDHRMYTEYSTKGRVMTIACCCGKSWYGTPQPWLGIQGINTVMTKTQVNKYENRKNKPTDNQPGKGLPADNGPTPREGKSLQQR